MSQQTEKRSRSGVRVPTGASIQVTNGFYQGLEVPIDREWLVIGRGCSADLVIAEPTISRAHAAVGFDADGFFVQDLGSTNETRVNRVQVERCALRHGDSVQLGRLVVEVRLPENVEGARSACCEREG